MKSRAEYQREWQRKNKHRTRVYRNRWISKNKKKNHAIQERWRKSKRCKLLVKARLLRKIFWTLERFQDTLKKQHNRCAICNRRVTLCADHNHSKKIPRGLLCSNCNLLLGNAKESIKILKRAICYLKAWRLR